MNSPAPATAVVVLAAGSGSRVGAGVNKVLLPLGGRPLLAHSVATATRVPGVRRVLVVVREGEQDEVAQALAPFADVAVEVGLVIGGATRHASEWAALQVLSGSIERGEIDVVAIHDGARPLAALQTYSEVISRAHESGAAVPATRTSSVLHTDLTPVPGTMVAMQTPQAFDAHRLLLAYRDADRDRFEGTDTAACFSQYADTPVLLASGSAANIKVTFAEDLALAENLFGQNLFSQDLFNQDLFGAAEVTPER